MTDRERYQKAFASIHLPEDFVFDPDRKQSDRRHRFRGAIAAACLACAVCIGGMTAYAADLNGIQRTIQVWLHGDQTTAVIDFNKDNDITHYSMTDRNGKKISGGGVKINSDGSESPLSAKEIQNDLNMPHTEVVNGRNYLYYKDKSIDITDRFDNDGLCYILIKDGDKKLYITAAKSGGCSENPNRYAEKNELPKEWFEK